MYKGVILFTTLVLALSAAGFLLAPAAMLAVVGVPSNPQTDFLLRSAGVGLAALLPGAWAVRNAAPSPVTRAVLIGLAVFMGLSSLVDFVAYAGGIVNGAAIPSIAFRDILGGILLWLAWKRAPQS